LRKILETIKLRLKDRYIEYLIYLMKKYSLQGNNSLDDLKYETMFNIIKNAPNDSNMNESAEDEEEGEVENNLYALDQFGGKFSHNQQQEIQGGDEEESEIVITTDQFNEKVDKILTKLNEYLTQKKMNVRDMFENEIFKPEFEDTQLQHITDDALYLKSFVAELKKINLELDTIDIYCIYTKLKIVDEFEAISVNVLEDELRRLKKTSGKNSEVGFKNASTGAEKNVGSLDLDFAQSMFT
jgi:hypothetical protein